MSRFYLAAGAVLLFGSFAVAVELPSETLAGWDAYISLSEARIERELSSSEGFLVMDFLDDSERSQCQRQLRAGEVCISKRESLDDEGRPIEVPGGLIHHWYGALLVPGADIDDVIDFVSTYDGREEFYEDVEDSRLLSHQGNVYRVFLRLKRKKVITAHFNTEHEVTYESHGEGRVSSRSIATRIREIDRAGTKRETERAEGDDRGFLWRLNSYWRFEQTQEGTVVECESASLSRHIPSAVEWLVREFIDSVPRESLQGTLLPIREALSTRP